MGKFKKILATTAIAVCSALTVIGCSDVPGYKVNITDPTGGNVTTNRTNAEAGDEITLSYTVDNGYEFKHFLVDGEIFQGTKFNMPKDNVEVTAVFEPITYTITYDLDGGELETGTTNPDEYDTTQSHTLNAPTKDHYDFAGWYTNESFEGQAITSITTGTYGNLELFAKWSPITYTITYNNMNFATNTNLNSYTIESGESGTITLQAPIRNGYAFIGWYDNENFNGSPVTEIQSSRAENIQLYAKWEGLFVISSSNGEFAITGTTNYTKSNVNELHIPNSIDGITITEVKDDAFNGCTLTTVTINSGIEKLGNNAFKNQATLTSVTLNNDLTTIGDYAFMGCTGLTSINIPNSVTSIGRSAFLDCTGLTSINIPNSIATIESGTFADCSGITSINIPNGVTSIGGSVFSGCTSLASVNIPNSVTSIGAFAFNGCTGLTSINIPNSVTEINDRAFQSSGLTSLNIPSSVNYLYNIVEFCEQLTTITVDPGNETYKSDNNCIIEKTSNTLILGINTSVIPDYVTKIGSQAFARCYGLTTITIPNNVSEISYQAFAHCNNLESVSLSNTLTVIGAEAFSLCGKLKNITIPASVTKIGSHAFRYSGLNKLTFEGDTPPSFVTNAFDESSLASIYVPDSSVSAYKKVFENIKVHESASYYLSSRVYPITQKPSEEE